MVLSRALESELVLPWADGPLPHPDLNEAGLALHTETERKVDDEGDAEADRAVYTFPGKPGPAWTVKVKAELGGTII